MYSSFSTDCCLLLFSAAEILGIKESWNSAQFVAEAMVNVSEVSVCGAVTCVTSSASSSSAVAPVTVTPSAAGTTHTVLEFTTPTLTTGTSELLRKLDEVSALLP